MDRVSEPDFVLVFFLVIQLRLIKLYCQHQAMHHCVLITARHVSRNNLQQHCFYRFTDKKDDNKCVEEILIFCDDLHIKYGFEAFEIKCKHVRAKPMSRTVQFKNICGKIQHKGLCNIYRDEVDAYLQTIGNSFGNFQCLSSIECNFSMCESQNYTLFRAARSSHEIADKITTALKTQCIASVFVHMIVCSAHLSKPVYCKHKCLLARLADVASFEVSDHDALSESYSNVCVKLANFEREFLARYLQQSDFPKQVCINIGRFGSINMFVSLPKHTAFDTDLEIRFTGFCQNLVDIIESLT